LFIGIGFGGVDCSETHLGFYFEVIFQSLSSLDLFPFGFSHCVWRILKEIWPRLINPRKNHEHHQSKIDVVKFDGINN